jgi:MFS transporter, OFA family, oxalate/formate antiporter
MPSLKYAKIPFGPSKWPFYYGWFIIALGTLGIIMSIPGQTIGVSTFTDSLIEVLNISRDQISLAYMVGTILSSFLLTKAGRLYDSHGARLVGGIGSVGLGISLIILSQVDEIINALGAYGRVVPVVLIMVVGFGFIRFFGQGVLTLVSRTMMMKWFDSRRGFATSFSNVFTALGFSMAPVYIEFLIQEFDWNGAWMVMGVTSAFIFPIVIFVFFRNSPIEVGLLPDGGTVQKKTKKMLFPVVKEFTLSEVRVTLIFWVFSLFLAMQSFYITGFTFHVVSIFESVNMERSDAIGIFPPMAYISVFASLFFGWVSDHIKLNYLLYSKGIASCIGLVGLIFLGQYEFAYYLLILGTGLMTGLFGVISAVSWPRLFGKSHLGAISGFNMTIIVFGSALGPMLFSLSESQTGNYIVAAGITLFLFLLLTVMATRIINPQIALNQTANQSNGIKE